VVALALLLAIGATAAVFLYTRGVKEDVESGVGKTSVLVSNQDIPANTFLDPLIEENVFRSVEVDETAAVEGAVVSTDQLRGQTTTVPILANEQIPLARLSGGEKQLSVIGVSKDHIGLTLRVDGPQGVGGSIRQGDNVTLFVTFDGVRVFKSVKELVKAGLDPRAEAPTIPQAELPPLTITLMPTVKVLKVENPTPGAEGQTSEGTVTLTLDVPKTEAAQVVFAGQKGQLWFGLLPPGEEGIQLPAATIPLDKILGKKA
jgi:Flp pilus assembly protein CpaB